MRHRFLEELTASLAARRVATLRYQFPYMERGSGRTDSVDVAAGAVRGAVRMAAELLPGLPLVAGGKSFGGRMTSNAQALEPLPGVRGLIFLGFPLHPPGRPGTSRGDHLDAVRIPMLFLQGTRDDFADTTLLSGVTQRLGARATVKLIEGGDHSFHVLKRSGRTDAEAHNELVTGVVNWIEREAS